MAISISNTQKKVMEGNTDKIFQIRTIYFKYGQDISKIIFSVHKSRIKLLGNKTTKPFTSEKITFPP